MLSEYQKARYEAFWRMDAIDSCLLHITCDQPDENGNYVMKEFWNWTVDKWFDIDRRTQDLHKAAKYAKFYGDGFLFACDNFGFGGLSANYGGSFTLADGTTWGSREPLFTDIKTFPSQKYDYPSIFSEKGDELRRRWIAENKGDYYLWVSVGMPLDELALLYGSEQVAMFMYDDPDSVIRATAVLTERGIAGLERSLQNYSYPEGVTTWWPVWSSKIFASLQCDFSAFISPQMFERFVLPDLERECNYLPRSVYHLDGPGEIPHLDLLLGIERLNAIQWIPGDGQPDAGDPCWYSLLRRIQAGGKGVIVYARPDRIEGLVQNLSTRGLFIYTDVSDEYEANKLLKITKAYGVK